MTDHIWLLSLEIAGQWHYLASRSITTSDGVRFEAGIDSLDYSRQQDYTSDVVLPDREARVTCTLSADLAALWALGHRITGGRGELALIEEGQAYTARVVLLSGEISEPEWEELGDPVSLILSAAPDSDQRLYPPDAAQINEDTWGPSWIPTAAPERSHGRMYPTVINRPGWAPDESQAIDGSPGYIVTRGIVGIGPPDILLIAGHPLGPAYQHVDAYTPGVALTGGTGYYVTVADLTTGTSASREVYHIPDSLGRIVAVVETDIPSGAGTLDPGDGTHEYAIRWDGDAVGLAGLRGETITHPAALIEWALSTSAQRYDAGRIRSLSREVDHIVVSGIIEEQVDLLEWLGDNLWPLLPISMDANEHGLYPVVRGHVRQDVRLVEGVNVWRKAVKASESTIGSVAVRYLLRYTGAVQHRSVLVSADAARMIDSVRGSALGRARRETIESDILVRAADAYYVAGWRLAECGRGWVDVDYASEDMLLAVPGDTVVVSDSRLSLTDKPGQVLHLNYDIDGATLRVRVRQ